MKNKTLQIIEYEPIKKDDIKDKYFKELEDFTKNNPQILIYAKKDVLKSQNFVGVIQTKSGFILEILPKISKSKDIAKSKEILLKMLKTLKNSPFKKLQLANLKSQKLPLFEIFIKMFLDELNILVKKGIKSDYILQNKNQNFLKGKLKIKEQISKNFIHKEQFFVEFDEYLPDRIENKIIKTTLKKLYFLSKNSKNQQRIREFLFIFDEVSEIKDIKTAFLKISLNKDMKYYQNILLWAKLFLDNQSFTTYKGSNIAFALLFDMNRLFESYVGSFFKRKCKNVKLQDSRYYLFDKPKKFLLKPDIVINNGNLILDTKWKIINEEKDISQSDLYQMFAYASRYEKCKRVYLIYPFIKDIDLNSYTTKINDKIVTVEIIFFDLEKNNIRSK